MKLKIYLFTIFSLISSQIFGQIKINSYWVMSQNNILIFDDSLHVQTNGKIGLNECSSSICDSAGNLLFYSDGLQIWNRYHKIVKNSEGLGFPQINYNTSRQGVLLLNSNENEIYLFNTDYQGKDGGVNYSVINLHSNADSGEVLVKKKQIVKFTNEAITAINHQNNQDIWILAHDVLTPNKFYKYLLTRDGLITCMDEQLVGPINYSGILDGQTNMKFSPDGRYLARTVGIFTVVELYEFNRLTGDLKFIKVVENHGNNLLISGLEFSRNSKFLYYVKRDSSIIQYDIAKGSKQILQTFTNEYPQQIQITPINNILVAIPYKNYYSTIENIEGTDAYYKDSSIFLKGNESFVDVPNFNQSYFSTPSIEFKYELNCISNTIQFWGYDTFKASSHSWQIKKAGKPAEGNYTIKNISHTFTDTGKYEVRYIASNGIKQDTVIKTVIIYPKINKNFLGNDTSYAQGEVFNRVLNAPSGIYCQHWQDSSKFSTFTVDTVGVYFCKVTNQAFCEVTDTITIIECINSLSVPNLTRSRDSLYAIQPMADSFIWFRNNVEYKITQEPYIRLTDTGTYRVEAAKKGYCNKSSSVYQIKKLGVNSLQLSDFGIQLFPNPTSGIIYIQSDKDFNLTVSDITGRIIHALGTVNEITLPQGVYFFSFRINNAFVVDKVVVL